MRSRFKLLSLAVGATVGLLIAGAFLVVLGIFDEHLGWDIFSPEAEKLLWGLFMSSVALGGFGAAISIVLGIQEVVKALRRLIAAANPQAAVPESEVPRRRYLLLMAGVAALLVLTVGALSVVNRRVEARRLATFKLIVDDQMQQLGPHLTRAVGQVPAPCDTCGNATLEELVETLEGLSFCQSATLFMADPADEAVLWRFPERQWDTYTAEAENEFGRFFIASDLDRAVKLALSGDTAWIDQMNGDPSFNWYQVVKDEAGATRAVLKVMGNPAESFRDYQAVAQAAAAR